MTRKARKSRDRESASRRFDLSAALPETHDYRLLKRFVFVAVAGILLAIYWAAESPISEVVTGRGKIATTDAVLRVEHPDGGQVRAVFVSTGDLVAAGDPLVAFDTDALERQRAVLLARRARLEAESRRIVFILDGGAEEMATPGILPRDLSQDERIFWVEQEFLAAQIERLDIGAAAIGNQIGMQGDMRAVLDAELAISRDHAQRLETLSRQGTLTRVDAERAQRDLLRMERQALDLAAAVLQGEDSLRENRVRRRELMATRYRDAVTRQSELDETQAAVEQELAEIEARLERAVVTSPIDGKVQLFPPAGAGDVILRSELVAEIVPNDSPVRTEIEVLASEIGEIYPGMEARVKVATFDFAWYGSVMGAVSSISPTSSENALGETVYEVVIVFPDHEGEVTLGGRVLRPGMTVTAEILGETKSILSYLLKPLRALKDGAFTET